jgi:stage V sporulation protein R
VSITVQSRRQTLTPELARLNREIEQHAREYGLDFYETIFEMLDFEEMNMVAAYGGFPNRYPHWKFGMEYERLNKSYAYGLHKIYEMVINNDPCYAYLLECNHLVDQKIVMAHVYGHCDFFKNNIWFSKTNRKMMDTMANHATKIRKYIDKHGLDAVETFIDVCIGSRSGRSRRDCPKSRGNRSCIKSRHLRLWRSFRACLLITDILLCTLERGQSL